MERMKAHIALLMAALEYGPKLAGEPANDNEAAR